MHRKLLNGKMIGVLAAILVLFMAVGVAAEDEVFQEGSNLSYLYGIDEEERTDASGQWWYVVNADGVTATVWQVPHMATAQMDVPHEIDSYLVTAIGDYAFESSTLERIILPDTVLSIGDGAFQWCFSLTEITLPDSLISIGSNVFVDVSLSQITLPGSLVSIGRGAFNYCQSLTEITLPESLISISPGAWWSCRNLSRIEVLPGNPVYASLDGVLFDQSSSTLHTYPCGKEGDVYTVPDGVTVIGELAFEDCDALTQVILPSSLTSIGEDAFYGCDELTLSVAEGSYAEQYAKDNGIPYEYIVE